MQEKIQIEFKCLYCNETLCKYHNYEKDKNKGYIICQKCKNKNDYDSLINVINNKAINIAKQKSYEIIKNLLKDNKFIK